MEEPQSIQETIAELQRKIRFVSNDIKTYTEDVQGKIKKQRSQINKIKKDNQVLKEELINLQKSKEPRPMTRTTSLLETPDVFQEKIDVETKKLKELENNIKIIQEKLFKQREQIGGINASRDNANALNKQLRILENRLDKANQKFNEAIAQNKVLREEIDNLRRERVIFDKIYQKLEKELHSKRKEMANIIETANNAYEDRDRAQDTLTTIKDQAKKEQVEFEKEWKNLNKLIEQDKKMKDFLKLRLQEKEQAENIEVPKYEEDSQKKKNKIDPQIIAAEKVKSYEEAFNKIQSATGILDIDVLVNTFIKAEDKNFTLFKFVNELSNDIETLEKQIQDLEQEVSACKVQEEDGYINNTSNVFEEKLEKYSKKAENYEKKYEESQKTLNSLKEEVTKFFYSIDCHKQLASEFLGETVTESVIKQFLTLAEQRSNEIFQAYALIQIQKGKSDFSMPGPQAPPSGIPPRIEAPIVKDEISGDEEEDLEDNLPLTVEEFKSRAKERAFQLDYQQKGKIKQTKPKVKK
jgi:coiled-coil domain-containing protein 63/114